MPALEYKLSSFQQGGEERGHRMLCLDKISSQGQKAGSISAHSQSTEFYFLIAAFTLHIIYICSDTDKHTHMKLILQINQKSE